MFRFIFCTVILSGFSVVHAQEKTYANSEHYYRTAIRHVESGGIGYENGYTTFETFFASDPSQWRLTPFLDVKGHVFNNGKWATNIGAGLRTLWKNRIYGINTYYDYRNTGHFHSNQVGIGFETLGELVDFRINGYLPVGIKASDPYDTAFGSFAGNYMILSQKYQFAMKGADAELGFHFGKSASFDFYAAAGPYYFIGEKNPSTWGGKARLLGIFKDMLTLEISSSYDRAFHSNLQGQISLNFSFGSGSEVKEPEPACKGINKLNARMLQPVGRQEIIVVDSAKKSSVAIDPSTGLPYFFVFVDNTSHSDGTYESPYHSLAQAQDNSSEGNIIYVFPGDGTTTGMDSGIFLKADQRFWGSGVNHSIQTSAGGVFIPSQSSSSPTITNTDVDTDGNAITLATHNAIRGFVITDAVNDAIYGADPQSLEVSSCTIQNTQTYAIEASFSGDASISLTNNQFLNNVNGVFLSLNGTSTVYCLDNIFTGQTSISSVPLEIAANSNTFTTYIENNVFNDNNTGSIRFNLDNVDSADIVALNNTITNNETGAIASLGSSLVILPSGTTDHCSIELRGNTFSGNTSRALYLDTGGAFTTLEATVTDNTISDNGGSALVFATPVDTFTLVATGNTIVGANDSAISVIASGTTSNGNITISNNTITDIGSLSNGIAINQDFSNLSLTILDNEINRCEGSGIISYAPSGIDYLTLNVSGNTINNCENLSSNAASAIDIEQYKNLEGSVSNNTLSDNTGVALFIGSTLSSPTTNLTLSGNSSSDEYLLSNPGDGLFNLSPCNVDTVNIGVINMLGDITIICSP